jgi:hypothetical protein
MWAQILLGLHVKQWNWSPRSSEVDLARHGINKFNGIRQHSVKFGEFGEVQILQSGRFMSNPFDFFNKLAKFGPKF